MLVAEDPKPGEFLTTTVIPFDQSTGLPARRRRRRSIRIQDDYRRQADGSLARVFRVIDKANGRYRETVQRDGVTVRDVDEPLRHHRGHGSAKFRARTGPDMRAREVRKGETMSSQRHPEIYANTNHLLRHLQSGGAQTPRQLEVALGDIDQIGIEQIEEWLAWAIESGSVEPTGGGRYNITQSGQGVIGPPDHAA